MKNILLCCVLHLLYFQVLNAQLEISNLNIVEIEDNIAMQQVPLELFNNSNTTVEFDWEIEYLNDSDTFLDISVSDINNDFTPQVITSCDLINATNTLAAQDGYTMGLHFRINDIPSGFDKSMVLGYYNLYTDEQCYIDTLISLPIFFNLQTSSTHVKVEKDVFLFPNPVKNVLSISNADSYIGEFVEIYGLDGRLILKEEFINSSIDLSGLANGVYFLRLNGERQTFIVIN